MVIDTSSYVSRINRTTLLSALVFCLTLSLPALAGSPPPPQQIIDQAAREADRIQREQRDRLEQERREEFPKRPRSSFQIEVPEPVAGGGDGPCREVNEIAVDGARLLPDQARLELTTPYIGQCMTVRDIERLLGENTKYYIDRGFIAARVYLQPQDLAAGILRVLVIEGVVEQIRLDEGETHRNVNLSTAFPGLIGDPFNLRDIEQGLDQIKRLASNNATLDIQPGEAAGGSIVLIRNKPARRVRANLSYDNHSGTSTGEAQAGLSVSLDNPAGINDSVNISHRRTTGANYTGQHSRSNSFLYSVPYGYFTFTGSYSWSDYASTIRPAGGDLIADGVSKSRSLTTEYVAYRDSINRVSVTGTLTAKNSRNFLAGQLLEVSSRKLSTIDLGVAWMRVTTTKRMVHRRVRHEPVASMWVASSISQPAVMPALKVPSFRPATRPVSTPVARWTSRPPGIPRQAP